MKPSERIQQILKNIIPKEGLSVDSPEEAIVLMGYGIQGIMDYLDEEHRKELAQKSTEKCYLEYVEGYLTCTHNHEAGEECLMNK